MPSEQTQTTNSSQNSTTQPWAPTRNSLTDILSRFTSMGGSGPSGDQTGALDMLKSVTANLPNLGGDALSAIKGMFNTNTSGGVHTIQNGYEGLINNLRGTASGAELDPYKTPGFGDAITRMTGDITDRVKGVYNASGRDPSGAGSFAGSLGRGLTEGIAPVIQGQYNTNKNNQMSAAGTLFGAANTTASNVAQQNQIPIENALKAISASGSLPGLFMQPGAAQYDIATKGADLPWQNLQRYLQGVLPIAALGSESQGTGTQTRVQPDSTMGNVMGGLSGLTGILGQTGAFGGAGWLSGMLGGLGGAGAAAGASSLGGSLAAALPLLAFSDERLKENISEVGETHDGQPLYQYNYIGDKVPRIGLMAQDVEKIRPDAVVEIGGYKAVDYGKATEGARKIGMMHKMLEAA